MKNSFYFNEKEIQKLDEFINCEIEIFELLVKFANLDKTKDFIESDLSGVDFSNSDIRGYNFSKADLSNCFGVNMLYDETTNFDGAKLNESIFKFPQEKKVFFRNNRDLSDIYNRIINEHWANGSMWFFNKLSEKNNYKEKYIEFSKYIYEDIKDLTFKNNILYGLNNVIEKNDYYKYFLLNQIYMNKNDTRSIRVILQHLFKFFSDDPLTKNMIIALCRHHDPEYRMLSIKYVTTQKYLKEYEETIKKAINDEDNEIVRRLYTEYMCNKFKKKLNHNFLYDYKRKQYYDYRVEMNTENFENIVLSDVKKCLYRDHKNLRYYIPIYNNVFNCLIKLNIPLNLKYDYDYLKKKFHI